MKHILTVLIILGTMVGCKEKSDGPYLRIAPQFSFLDSSGIELVTFNSKGELIEITDSLKAIKLMFVQIQKLMKDVAKKDSTIEALYLLINNDKSGFAYSLNPNKQ